MRHRISVYYTRLFNEDYMPVGRRECIRDSSTHNLPAAAYLGVDQGHFRDTAASCVFVFLCEYACVGISFLCLSRHSRATSAADNEQLSVMAHDVDSFMPRPVI